MSDVECRELTKQKYLESGWKIDRDDEEYLSFTKYENEDSEWCHDYNIKQKIMVTLNLRAKINLMSTKT